jgi:hypothetical protein
MDMGQITRNAEAVSRTVQQNCAEPPLAYLTSVLIKGQTHETKLMDISLAGAIFMAQLRLGNIVGNACRVDLRNSGGSSVLPLSGTVIHSEGQLLVIKFIALDVKQYSRLSNNHERNGGAPELLWRGIAELMGSVSSHEPAVNQSPLATTAPAPDTRGHFQRRQCDRANLSQVPAPFHRLTWLSYRSNQMG